jgi:hypothetical protein
MSTQPEALRLIQVAPYLEGGERSQWIMDAAAEMTRLSQVNAELLYALEQINVTPCSMVNDSESLRHTIEAIWHTSSAAIAKATGATHD